ncbi:MAG: ABC transporter permease [Desulfovibrionaceae bacterium]|nr:ABC transporter permease [Desulfovibrionaceae bacterium]
MTSFASHVCYCLRSNIFSAAAVFGVLVLAALSVLGPLLTPYDAYSSLDSAVMLPPSWAHPCGTDQVGRDVLSRIMMACRLDMAIALSAVLLSLVSGTIVGSLAGYYGGFLDGLVSRLVDTIMAFPLFVLAMAIVASLGNSVVNIVFATAVINLPFYIRVARAETAVRRQSQFVEAALISGNTGMQVIVRHILPNIMPTIMVQASLNLGWAILNAAGLSFIGLGVRPPDAEWGIMVAEGAQYIVSGEWWIALFPGIALMLTVLCFNFLGDALRDILDPRRRS